VFCICVGAAGNYLAGLNLQVLSKKCHQDPQYTPNVKKDNIKLIKQVTMEEQKLKDVVIKGTASVTDIKTMLVEHAALVKTASCAIQTMNVILETALEAELDADDVEPTVPKPKAKAKGKAQAKGKAMKKSSK
jgi:hypothetical protein